MGYDYPERNKNSLCPKELTNEALLKTQKTTVARCRA